VTPQLERLASQLVLGMAGLTFVAVALPYLHLPFGGDHGYFAYTASRLRAGAVLYRDVWDQNGPLPHVIEMVAEGLFGRRMTAIRAFDLAWMLATLAVLHRATLRAAGPLAASLAVLLAIATYFTLGHRTTAQRDGFSVLLTLGMLLAATNLPASQRARNGVGVAIGVLVSALFWLKPPLVLAAAVPVAIALGRDPRQWFARSVPLAIGAALGLGFPVWYFWRYDALGDLYECVIVFNAQYATVRHGILELLSRIAIEARVRPFLLVGFVGALAGLRSARLRPLAALTFAYLAVAIAQGKLAGYHQVPTQLMLCAFTGVVVASGLRAARWALVARIAALLVLVSAAWPAMRGFQTEKFPSIWATWLRDGTVRVRREETQLANFVARASQPDETVLVWGLGTAGLVNSLSERKSPTRFFHDYPFSAKRPDTDLVRRWREEFIAKLREAPPRLVVVVSGDSWPDIDNVDSSVSFERFTALRDFVETHYERAAELSGALDYRIYRRRD
jgi:hypothetical protein